MKKRAIHSRWLIAAMLLLYAGVCGVLLFYSLRLGAVAFGVWILSAIVCIVLSVRYRRMLSQILDDLTDTLDPRRREALSAYPMPVAVLSDEGEMLFVNGLFTANVCNGREVVGLSASDVFNGFSVRELQNKTTVDLRCGKLYFTAFIGRCVGEDKARYVLYFSDTTKLKLIAAEYAASRPVALLICIDNLEEASRTLRDGERTRLTGQIETMLDDWISRPGGVLRKFGSDRFMAITEYRCLTVMADERFSILDSVRTTFAGVNPGLTVSIGVGQGKTLQECERMAKQALEMALARGGDQAAIKTTHGYDFYGGRSKGVERRTKVRTRVMANALRDLIMGSDRVYVMGHRFSDLDSLGSAVALTIAARRLGVEAYAVLHASSTMAGELLRRYQSAGTGDVFMEPEDALNDMSEKSLLVITDTHIQPLLDSPELFRAAKRVAIIDHHRKMANAITDVALEYQESSSSSACELVTELLQYMGEDLISGMEAEALLSGIMLDTRNFVLRTGVRTFEAAAYLRRLGADTVSVKRMFSESLDLYRKKCDLVNAAYIFHHMAISSTQEDCSGQRTAAAQAADELMTVHGIVASYVLFPTGNDVNISARSYGEFNVQLIMEALGGGGHMTMAGTQLRDTTVEQAEHQLVQVLTDYIENNHLDL
ncbi:MAG: hypothetical protein E7541_03610 [Ruminococcaceae bacterium]|nr:hypothetical protein [Oscillospiraceae bacterium]